MAPHEAPPPPPRINVQHFSRLQEPLHQALCNRYGQNRKLKPQQYSPNILYSGGISFLNNVIVKKQTYLHLSESEYPKFKLLSLLNNYLRNNSHYVFNRENLLIGGIGVQTNAAMCTNTSFQQKGQSRRIVPTTIWISNKQNGGSI
jgi:hypothetical protein